MLEYMIKCRIEVHNIKIKVIYIMLKELSTRKK